MGNLKRVVLAGGTGLVGRHLAEALSRQGVQVVILSRNPGRTPLAVGWEDLPGALEGADAVINLAGEGIASRRWTSSRKADLLRSRVESTSRIVAAMAALATPPPVLVNASAVGIYGPMDGRPVTEAQPPGRSFLARLCRQWEAAAEAPGIRVVKLRLGVVLAREGGALGKMAWAVRLFQGTKLGHGQQGFSWIHIDDLVRLCLEAASNPAYAGAVNATSPRPLTNEAFTRALARQLHRPLLPVPAFVTRAALGLLTGEMGREMLLQGAFVYPEKAQALGFRFNFERAEEALADLL